MSPLFPDEPHAGVRPTAPQPVIPVGAPRISDVRGLPAATPWERRQPQVERRPVLPVEWFRRMPGGGTTYAPDDTAPATGPDDRT